MLSVYSQFTDQMPVFVVSHYNLRESLHTSFFFFFFSQIYSYAITPWIVFRSAYVEINNLNRAKKLHPLFSKNKKKIINAKLRISLFSFPAITVKILKCKLSPRLKEICKSGCRNFTTFQTFCELNKDAFNFLTELRWFFLKYASLRCRS